MSVEWKKFYFFKNNIYWKVVGFKKVLLGKVGIFNCVIGINGGCCELLVV